MELTEHSRQNIFLVLIMMSLICLASSFLMFVSAVNIKVTIDKRISLLETYNSQTIPVLFLFVGVINMVENGSCAFISFRLRNEENREGLIKTLLIVLIAGILLVILEIASAIASFVHIGILDREFGEGLTKAMTEYAKGGELKQEIDYVQTTHDCCGEITYTDWFTYPWIDADNLVSSHTKYLQDQGQYFSDDTPYSCCDRRSYRPCIHHHIHDNQLHHNYDYKLETTLHTNGCRKILAAMYSSILVNISVISLLTAALKIFMLLLLRLTQTSLSFAQKWDDWTATTPAYIYYYKEDESGDLIGPESQTEDEGETEGETDNNKTDVDETEDERNDITTDDDKTDNDDDKTDNDDDDKTDNDDDKTDDEEKQTTADEDETDNNNDKTGDEDDYDGGGDTTEDETTTDDDKHVDENENRTSGYNYAKRPSVSWGGNYNLEYHDAFNDSNVSNYSPKFYKENHFLHNGRNTPVPKSFVHRNTPTLINGWNVHGNHQKPVEPLFESDVGGGRVVSVTKSKVSGMLNWMKDSFIGPSMKSYSDYPKYRYSTLKSQNDLDCSEYDDYFRNQKFRARSGQQYNSSSNNPNKLTRETKNRNYRTQNDLTNKDITDPFFDEESDRFFDNYSEDARPVLKNNVSELVPLQTMETKPIKNSTDKWQPLSLEETRSDKLVAQLPGQPRDKGVDISGISNKQISKQKSITQRNGTDDSYHLPINSTECEIEIASEFKNHLISQHVQGVKSKVVKNLLINNPELQFGGEETPVRLPPPNICNTAPYEAPNKGITRPQPILATDQSLKAVIVDSNRAWNSHGMSRSSKDHHSILQINTESLPTGRTANNMSKHFSSEYDLIPTIQRRGHDLNTPGNATTVYPDFAVEEVSPEVAGINFPQKLNMDCSIDIEHHTINADKRQKESLFAMDMGINNYQNTEELCDEIQRAPNNTVCSLEDEHSEYFIKPLQKSLPATTKLPEISQKNHGSEERLMQCQDINESFSRETTAHERKIHIRSTRKRNIFLASPIYSSSLDISTSSVDSKFYPTTSTPIETKHHAKQNELREYNLSSQNLCQPGRKYTPQQRPNPECSESGAISNALSNDALKGTTDNLIDLSDPLPPDGSKDNDASKSRPLTLISPFD